MELVSKGLMSKINEQRYDKILMLKVAVLELCDEFKLKRWYDNFRYDIKGKNDVRL